MAHSNKRKTEADYHALAKERGFEWLGAVLPPSTKQLTLWRCSQQHTWQMRYINIWNGQGCPVCAGKARRTAADYHELAKQRGATWLGLEAPINSRTRTQWKCRNGHDWYSTYTCVMRYGCPTCSGVIKKTRADYDALSLASGYECLDTEVANTYTKCKWQCTHGHIWISTYKRIKRGDGCPECNGRINGNYVSEPQLELAKLIAGGTVNQRIGRYSVDICLTVNGVNIGIEYDCWYWHQDKEQYSAQRDARLNELGWRMLHVKAGRSLPTREQLDAAISELVNGATYAEIVLDDWKESA